MQADTVPVEITLRGATLHGDLEKPPGAESLVVFAHGSGSSRFSARVHLIRSCARARHQQGAPSGQRC